MQRLLWQKLTFFMSCSPFNFSPSTSFCSKCWRNVGQYNWCRAGKPFWKFSTGEESVKMIKSAFIIQPESNQDFYVKSTFKSCYFFPPLTVFILWTFFLSLVVFSLGPIGYKNQVYNYILYNYIPGFYSFYRVSSGQIILVIWVNLFSWHNIFIIIKCWFF